MGDSKPTPRRIIYDITDKIGTGPVQTVKKDFLKAFSAAGVIGTACKVAGVTRRLVQSWRETDPGFAAEYDDAYDNSTDELEFCAWRRALQESDTLLIFMLKARRPEKYRDPPKQFVAFGGAGGGPIEFTLDVGEIPAGASKVPVEVGTCQPEVVAPPVSLIPMDGGEDEPDPPPVVESPAESG